MKFLGLIEGIVLALIALIYFDEAMLASGAVAASAGGIKLLALKVMCAGVSAIFGFILFMLIYGLGMKFGEPMAISGSFIFSTMIGFHGIDAYMADFIQWIL